MQQEKRHQRQNSQLPRWFMQGSLGMAVILRGWQCRRAYRGQNDELRALLHSTSCHDPASTKASPQRTVGVKPVKVWLENIPPNHCMESYLPGVWIPRFLGIQTIGTTLEFTNGRLPQILGAVMPVLRLCLSLR